MYKIRVSQISEELNVPVSVVIRIAKELGCHVFNPMSFVPIEDANKIRNKINPKFVPPKIEILSCSCGQEIAFETSGTYSFERAGWRKINGQWQCPKCLHDR